MDFKHIMIKNTGGAQYITKNNTFEYWNDVEKYSHPLLNIINISKKLETLK